MIYAYSPDALVYNSSANTWSLRPDYDFTQHRVQIDFTDNDTYLDGDAEANEVGDDTTQTAIVSDTSGNLIASGRAYDEEYYNLEGPGSTKIHLDVIEINGVVVGFVTSATLTPGASYPQLSTGNVIAGDDDDDEDTRITYSQIHSVPCFVQGSCLSTDQGDLPVDWIRAGDRVLTHDNGFQPVLWADRTVMSASALAKKPKLRPIRFAKGCAGNGVPTQDLLLSPEHRILLKSHQIELMIGHDEAFAAAKAIISEPEISQTRPDRDIIYYHIMFENHEVVLAEGLWVESFFPGKMALAALSRKKQTEIRTLLGPRIDKMETARPCLKKWEAMMLVPQNKHSKKHTGKHSINRHLSAA